MFDHPLSASWHGTTHDVVDLILEDYDIIPLDAIASVEQPDDYDDEKAHAADLEYVDLSAPQPTYFEGRFD